MMYPCFHEDRCRPGAWVVAALVLLAGALPAGAAGGRPKYVFLFVGDGMASAQIHAAEAFLASQSKGDQGAGKAPARLAMRKLPVLGTCTTYARNRFITDSAAAATALACGRKTDVGVVSMAPDRQTAYPTLAELAHGTGRSVGIVSSVSIDHATPACFYAHMPSRNSYHEISLQLARSPFEFFGGGGMKGQVSGRTDAHQVARRNGLTLADSPEALAGVPAGGRVLAWNASLGKNSSMHYELDRRWLTTHGRNEAERNQVTLAGFTRQAIRVCQDDSEGFFLMIEGGKIDWACHANDAMAAIMDTIAFDQALAEALAFQARHPQETLIVVTGDHECGGLALGFAGTAYTSAFEVLGSQKVSHEVFRRRILADYLADYDKAHPGRRSDWDADAWNMDERIKSLVAGAFGLHYDKLRTSERRKLEQAYDHTMSLAIASDRDERERQYLLYGRAVADGAWDGYDPLTVTCTHVLNHRAGVAWTTYSHTGIPVPIFAAGPGAEAFGGYCDNTAIAHRLASAMGTHLAEAGR